MTPRQRVQAVYQGQIPDQVPLMLDLSHWYKKNFNVPFDLTGFKTVEWPLVELHRKYNAVCYVEVGNFYDLYFEDNSVTDRSWTDNEGVFHHCISTPVGQLHEERVFQPASYSYAIRKYLLDSIDDLKIVSYFMERCNCRPRFEHYHAWNKALGDLAYLYGQIPYSGLGYLISRNFGVEKTCLAIYDYPEEIKKVVDTINKCNLRILDVMLDSPAEVIFLSDNLDSNIQTEALFKTYSLDFYREVARRIHNRGKYFAVHVDGEAHGCLQNLALAGVDCIDAVTPEPMFTRTPAQLRQEAGPNLILSGGIPAIRFGSSSSDEQFINCVCTWLASREYSYRLILAAGDQVPPDALPHRIAMLSDLIATYGTY